MTFVLSYIISLLGFLKPKSKIISFFIIIFLWILYGWNTSNIDYYSYENIFVWSQAEGIYNPQFGYEFLNVAAYLIGLNYTGFRILISIMGLIMIFYAIKRYTSYSSIVLILYFIFPFLLDVVQIKNFLSMAIMLFAIRYLIYEGKNNSLKYILCILIASSIHFTALFYLFFLLAKIKNIKSLIVIVTISCVIGLAASYTGLLRYLATLIIPIVKVNQWFTPQMGLGFFIITFIHLLNSFLVYYSYSKSMKYINGIEQNKYLLTFIQFVYKINIIYWLLFPLYAYNMIFFRIYRNSFILFYILFIMCLFNKNLKYSERAIFGTLVLLFSTSMLIYNIIIPHFHDVFISIFIFNNLF